LTASLPSSQPAKRQRVKHFAAGREPGGLRRLFEAVFVETATLHQFESDSFCRAVAALEASN
jgi:hypothetical protein